MKCICILCGEIILIYHLDCCVVKNLSKEEKDQKAKQLREYKMKNRHWDSENSDEYWEISDTFTNAGS